MYITDNATIKKAVDKYGTPLYIFNTDIFGERYEFFKKLLGPDIKINFCMKANPFLVSASLKYTDRIEVCSFGEFLICKSLDIPSERLLISGVLKKEKDLAAIMEYCLDKAEYTAESPAQLICLNKKAFELGIKVKVLLRLSHGQFGMDEDTIIALLNDEHYDNIEFWGIHYFTGTQKGNLCKHAAELNKLDLFFERIRTNTGKKVKCLEYGTGFDVPYFYGKGNDFLTEENMRTFADMLTNMKFKGDIRIEMGRALSFDSGLYITKILDTKCSDEKNYCILDGGIHQINYDGQMYGMHTPYIRTIRSLENEETQHYCLCGSLCTTRDILAADFESKPLSNGDIVIFERVGAYSVYEGMSLFLSHELPGVCLYSKAKELACVRAQTETFSLNTPVIK